MRLHVGRGIYRVPIRAIPKKRGEMTERKSLSKSPPGRYTSHALNWASSECPRESSFRFGVIDYQKLDSSISCI